MEFFPRLPDEEENGACHTAEEEELPTIPLQILLTLEDNLFVRIAVPKQGVVCSNQSRVDRICSVLDNRVCYEVPWGPKIYIGEYKSTPFFIASAPVGSGSGLMFTELYAAGAEYIVRYGSDDYGSDDVKNPGEYEHEIIKIIDEADNLYGYNIASGTPEEDWGQVVAASHVLVKCLKEESNSRNLQVETRICHHLENYHSLRTPHKFASDREKVLRAQLAQLEARKDANAAMTESGSACAKKSSFDMETAVLFTVAKDFTGYTIDSSKATTGKDTSSDYVQSTNTGTNTGTNTSTRSYVHKHAASVLQTVNKENHKLGPYEGENKTIALKLEQTFIEFILSAMMRL